MDHFLKWLEGLVEQVPNLVLGLLLLLFTWLLARGARRVANVAGKRAGLVRGAQRVVARGVYSVIMVIGVLIALSVALPGLDLGAALGALGVGGIVAGFALKDIIENFVAGVLILFTHPFGINDQIVTESHEGTVVDIQFRATVVRTYDNRAVLIPNSELYTNRVTVNTRYEKVRHKVDLTFPNSYPIEPLRKAVVEALSNVDGTLDDPAPEALVTELGNYSNTLTARYWVGPPTTRGEITHVTDKVLTQLLARFSELEIQNIRPEAVVFQGPVEAPTLAS